MHQCFSPSFNMRWVSIILYRRHLDTGVHTCMEDLDQDVKPVLSPSSTQSVSNWAPTWFLFVSLIFGLPITLTVVLFPLASIFSPTLLEICIQILKISPLRASILVGYFLVVLFLWSVSSILLLYINLDVNLHDTASIFSPSFTSGSHHEWSNAASSILLISHITHVAWPFPLPCWHGVPLYHLYFASSWSNSTSA